MIYAPLDSELAGALDEQNMAVPSYDHPFLFDQEEAGALLAELRDDTPAAGVAAFVVEHYYLEG